MAAPSRTVKVKFDGDTKGLAIAAKQGERIVDRFADNASRTVTSRFRSWFTGRGADESNTIGRFFARTFGTGLLSGFSVPVFGPAMLGVLLGVVALVAPTVGAALATGIVAAFGAGIAGLGLVFAAQSAKVEAAFSGLKDALVADLQGLARPFEQTLIQIAGFVERTFTSFKPILADAFAGLAPVVTKFADQFFAALERFKPAVTAISDAFSSLLGDLGPKLPTLFDDIADTIEGIAGTISENSDAFASLVTFFLDAADAIVEAVGALASFYAEVRQIAQELLFPLQDFGPKAAAFSASTAAAMASTDGFTGSLRNATQALTDYAAAQQAATDPVFALIQAATAADEAQSAYNEAVAEFGATSPQATAAALAAAQAVAGLEQAALNGELSFAAFDRKLDEWVASGRVTAAQASTIRDRVAEARGEAEDFQGTYEATVAVKDRASAALQSIRAWLDRIQSKTVTITARTQIPAGVSIRQLMERQHGGPVTAYRSYLVGEKGPEILTMGAQSGHITPNHKIGADGGGGWDARLVARAIGDAINGARLIVDDRGTGRLVVNQAALYGRGG